MVSIQDTTAEKAASNLLINSTRSHKKMRITTFAIVKTVA